VYELKKKSNFSSKASLFCELWEKENNTLAFQWSVEDFESEEPDLPEFTRRQAERKEQLRKKSDFIKYICGWEHVGKIIISYCVLFLMVTNSVKHQFFLNIIKTFKNC
jgi:hypothetical protein